MDISEFTASLKNSAPPTGLSGPALALWREARGDWDAAHQLVQDDPSAEASWVHAHLHRKEGDLGNAAYWYRRAGKPVCAGSLEEEWRQIAAALI